MLWEMRISRYIEPALLYVNCQISTEYHRFTRQLFSKSKLLISTNALNSSLPLEYLNRRARALLSIIPHVIIQAVADYRWWIGYTTARWPLRFISELVPFLGNSTTIELICRWVGNYIYLPRIFIAGPGIHEANLRGFFHYKIPLPNPLHNREVDLPSSKSAAASAEQISHLTVLKTLIIELCTLKNIFGGGIQGSDIATDGVRDMMNRNGAQFPSDTDWIEMCTRPLDPILGFPLVAGNIGGDKTQAIVYTVVERGGTE
jgi:hypothetical protein